MKSVPAMILTGKPDPMGCSAQVGGYNFAVHSPWADKVELCLFSPDTEEQMASYMLPGKTGQVWHGFLPDLDSDYLYGYRVHGKDFPEMGLVFNAQKLLIDPYAKRLNRPAIWSRKSYQGDSQFMVPKAFVAPANEFDWQGVESPHVPIDQRVIYELHAKGFTQLHPDIEEAYRGTYLGLSSQPVIEYLKSLGVTCIQLMPVASFMPEPFVVERGLTNYWGYNPINFFAPECRYAVLDPVNEFKTMVRELHRNGIKVILDVVYNHTAEGGLNGPMLSFKGFDNKGFYLYAFSEGGGLDYNRYMNNSGCGNSVNMDNNFALRLILDALRYWVTEMHVDGFRFDLSASLARENYEFRHSSAFFRAVKQDPILNQVIAIAEPWDLGHGGYRLGHFPVNWFECNDKYRDRIRSFWRGDKNGLGDFATRIMGSRDIFPKNHRPIQASVNFITYHDGYTLQDLVSYNERKNEANGESNQDGSNNNLSFNYGEEGKTHDPEIVELRLRQKRNFFATLLLSQGTPHILGGDEMGRTQQGNNNAYCQDNEISWVNWHLEKNERQLLTYFKHMVRLRREHRLLRNIKLIDDSYFFHKYSDTASWFNPDGTPTDLADWHDEDSNAFTLWIKTMPGDPVAESLLILVNACKEDKVFHFTQAHWQLLLDTRYPSGLPGDALEAFQEINEYPLIGRNIVILKQDLKAAPH